DHYPFLIGLNNEKGLFISHDAGINWLNITGNLPFQYQNKEAIIYGGNLLKKDGKLLQNVIHHGLYEMEDPLPVKTIEVKNTSTFDLFPIPCSDFLYLKAQDLTILNSKINIYDFHGRKLTTNKIVSNDFIVLNLSSFQSGIYILEIIDSAFTFNKYKFIKY
ncbi:MAG: T9SS type A sorting domain-containing protein, partial [Saprospiraceae bacterium]|nr:T9SS type A sorting domain-containing protein [Saprospiraceae bacterium]